MNIRFWFIFLFFVLEINFSIAQTSRNVVFEFQPLFGNSELRLNESFYKLNQKDSIQIETLRFYVSGIELIDKNKTVWKSIEGFYLVDASNIKSLQISLKIPSSVSFNKIKFNLGIDSLTNVSGAMGGDLDPTKGMYWTWQSGYVNFKLEGKSNLCKTRNNVFQFHIGGYLYPFCALQALALALAVKGNEKNIILVDIAKLISTIDLSVQNQIMTPDKEAVLISQKASKIFSIKE